MTLRTLAAALGTTAVLTAAAAPALAQSAAGTYPTDTGTTTTQSSHDHRGHHGRKLTDAQLTTVATALGVTLEQLKAAQAAVKTATDATTARETPDQKDALLATQLGVTAAQVKAAFSSVRPAAGTGRGAGGDGHGDCPGKTGTTGTTGATGTYPSDS